MSRFIAEDYIVYIWQGLWKKAEVCYIAAQQRRSFADKKERNTRSYGGLKMSYNSQALTAYKETRVKTASQGSLIIMLYDEGIKNITLALEGMPDGKIEAENIERIHQYILKAQDIITELMASLNMDDGGEIAENLLSLYSFFNQQLFQANMQKDPAPLVTVRGMMMELREAWQHVVNSTSIEVQPAASGVNIAG